MINKKTNKFFVDLTSINISEFVKLVKSIYPNEKLILSLPNFGDITLSDKNLKNIYQTYDDSKIEEFEGSDAQFVNRTTMETIMAVYPVITGKSLIKGGFFPYYNKTKINLKFQQAK